MPKLKTRKESVKRLIDTDGNVQAMIFLEIQQDKDSVSIGFRSRFSYDAAESEVLKDKTDLWQYCPHVRNDSQVIAGINVDMGYFKDFFAFATEEEKKTLRDSAKYPFGFYCGSVLRSENFLKYFIESYDEATQTLRYETEVLLAVAQERGWSVV